MLAFYMDHHIPRAITKGLRARGIDALTAYEDGMAEDDDEPILERASSQGRIVFTHDQDFLEIAARWQSESREFSGIAFVAQERIATGQVIDYLELIAKTMTVDEMHNRVEYIPSS